MPREAGTNRGGDPRDFVLHLQSLHAKIFPSAKLFQNIGRRSNGVGTQEKFYSCFFGCRDQSVRGRCISIHVGIKTLFSRYRFHPVRRCREMDVIPVIIPVGERFYIRAHYFLIFSKLLLQQFIGNFQRAVKEPADHSQCKHVLAAENIFIIQFGVLQGSFRERRDIHADRLHLLQPQLFEWLQRFEVRFIKIPFLERIVIVNHDRPFFQELRVYLKRGRVHGDQHVRLISRIVHVLRSNPHLESRDPMHRTLRGTYFCRVVGISGNFISKDRRQS